MNNNKNLATVSGIAHIAYGVHVDPKKDPFAFDDYDLWFGNDFDWIINELFEDVFADLEEIISSDWSTNLSEALSAKNSLLESADREAKIARGLNPTNVTSVTSLEEASDVELRTLGTMGSNKSTDSVTRSAADSAEGTHDSGDF